MARCTTGMLVLPAQYANWIGHKSLPVLLIGGSDPHLKAQMYCTVIL